MAKARTGNVPIPRMRGGTAKKRQPAGGSSKAGQVLDQRDAGPEDGGVRRPGRVRQRVDVERVDPDERRPRFDELSAAAPVRNGLSQR